MFTYNVYNVRLHIPLTNNSDPLIKGRYWFLIIGWVFIRLNEIPHQFSSGWSVPA